MSKGSFIKTYVCLRCQSRLYINRVPRLLYSTHYSNASSQSTPSTDHLSEEPSLDGRSGQHQTPSQKLSVFRPERPHSPQWSALLEHESLGVPVEVVVFRDGDSRRFGQEPKNSATVDNSRPSTSTEDILASVRTSLSYPDQEDVETKIESMAPSRSTYSDDQPPTLLQDEYNLKFRHLYEQFNHRQLEEYYKKGIRAQIRRTTDDTKMSASKRFRRTPWKSLSTDISNTSIYTPAQYSLTSPKSRVINKILRLLWNILVVEDTNQPGEVEVHTDQVSLSLLLAGDKQSALRQIGTEASAKIEVFRSDGLIKITASRAGCVLVFNRIQQLFEHYHERVVNLSSAESPRARPKLPNPSALLSLCRLSRSTIEISKNRRSLILRSLNATDSQHANRMLFALITRPARTAQTLCFGENTSSKNILCAPVSQSASLAFKYRQEMLGRYIAATDFKMDITAKDVTAESLRASETSRALFKKFRSFLPLISDAEQEENSENTKNQPPSNEFGWQMNFETVWQCDFGKVIHSCGRNWFASHDEEQLQKYVTGRRSYAFDSTAPLGSNIVKALKLPSTGNLLADAQGRQMDILRIKLIPQIATPSHDSEPSPAIELLLTVDRENQNVDVKSLEAVIQRKEMGVMFPSLTADVQFVRTTRARNVDPNAQPAIAAFIREMQNHFVGFGMIQTPPILSLQIPKIFYSKEATNLNGGSDRIDYVVSEIQYSQSVLYNYDGLDLVWTHQEGGDVGGRREELSLHLRSPNSATNEQESSAVNSGDAATGEETSTSTALTHGRFQDYVHRALDLLDQIQAYSTKRSASRVRKRRTAAEAATIAELNP